MSDTFAFLTENGDSMDREAVKQRSEAAPARAHAQGYKYGELKQKVLQQVDDARLHSLLSEMTADDQTWVIYALIASACSKREVDAMQHLRDLLSGGTVLGLTEKALETRLAPLQRQVAALTETIESMVPEQIEEMTKKQTDKVLLSVKKLKELAEQADEELKADVKAEVRKGIVTMSDAAGARIAEQVGESVSKRISNGFMAIVGVAVIVALGFGFMAGAALA